MTDNGDNRCGGSEVPVHEAHALLQQNDGSVTLIDVRGAGNVLGHIKGAVFMSPDDPRDQKHRLPERKDSTLLVYCASGRLSAPFVKALRDMGYTSAFSIRGGFNAWQALGYEVVNDGDFTPAQLQRYSRNITLQEVGVEGQKRLLNSRVIIAGAGGLGCPAALYLAAAGVGTIGIADFDLVDLSNLNRQVLHTSADVGRMKTESARDAIRRLNPEVTVITHDERLTAGTILDVIKDYDVVMEASDNIKTKLLLNDACHFAGKPYVFGGAVRFVGQVGVFNTGNGGPCLRCLFPNPGEDDAAPSCSEAGVMGVVPGLVGLVQATEVLKLLIGIGKPMIGRFFFYNALDASFDTIMFEKNPSCPLCGEEPEISDLSGDYMHRCRR
jgi:molybdopterin/thiamine biosynthesis adenylyltransferase/rhodanese-related sulfurtransferase